VNVESAIYGALMGIALVLVIRRMGVRMTPWPEALLGTLVGVALWLGLRLAGIDNLLSITIGFLAGSFIVSIWKRFRHRPA
jgi:hypothetical protein